MSTSSHDFDLRKKVIEAIEAGEKQNYIASVFKIGIKTVNNWWLRYKREGHFLPRKRLGSKAKIDKECFAKFVTENPNSRIKDYAAKFNISNNGAWKNLKKLGFVLKKILHISRSRSSQTRNILGRNQKYKYQKNYSY